MLAHTQRQRAEEALSKLGLHAGQEQILFLLWEQDGLTPTQLAARFSLGLATIVKTVQRMERAGILVRHSDPADRRAWRVYLTEHGRSLYKPALQVWQTLAARTIHRMTEIEQVLFRRLLEQAIANLVSDDDSL